MTAAASPGAHALGGDTVSASRPAAARRWAGAALRALVGVILCLTPLTAVIALGWLTRLTRREVAIGLARRALGCSRREARRRLAGLTVTRDLADPPRWVTGGAFARTRAARILGGLRDNACAGTATLAALACATAPFGLVWLAAWWAGWENSFNKGYEQAWAGPVLALAGVALALPILTLLPLALAHQAFERRLGALLDVGALVRLAARSGARLLGLSVLVVLAALPLFILNALPTFIESVHPRFADLSPDEVRRFAGRYHLLATVYLFAALVGLRRLFARTYAAAVMASIGGLPARHHGAHAAARALLVEVGAGRPPPHPRRPGRLAAAANLLALVLALVVSFLLVAQVFVGQFVRHSWWGWLNQPLLGLPWLPPLV